MDSLEHLSMYNISKNIFEVINEGFVFDEETGEIKFDASQLEDLEMALDDKLNKLIGVKKYYEDMVEISKKRKEEFDEKMKKNQKKVDSIVNTISYFMKKHNFDKKTLSEGTISFRKSTSVDIENLDKVLEFLSTKEEYKDIKKTKIDVSVDKNAIKKIINSGIDVPGASIITNENISIK